jgi:hypothetical protein
MQRYKIRCNDCDPKITPHENGKWVRWGDVERLRAELAERKATTPAPKPDCRTCSKYLPPIYAFSEPACPRRKISMDPCINGSHYRPADPVRLYETGEA